MNTDLQIIEAIRHPAPIHFIAAFAFLGVTILAIKVLLSQNSEKQFPLISGICFTLSPICFSTVIGSIFLIVLRVRSEDNDFERIFRQADYIALLLLLGTLATGINALLYLFAAHRHNVFKKKAEQDAAANP